MNTRYKSRSMTEVMGSYQGPDVDERTKRIILSSEANPADVYEAALQDLKQQEQRLNEIGREHMSGPLRLAYRLTDRFIGVTAFDYRVRRQQGALAQARHALEFRVNKYKDLSESSREELRELRKLQRGARLLRTKFKSMESALVQKEQTLTEQIDMLKEELSKSPENYLLLQKIDQAEAELEDYRADLEKVGEERTMASSKFLYFHNRIAGAEQQRLQLNAYMRALQQKYFRTTITESKLAGLSTQGLDPVGTMEVLASTTKAAQGIERFADAAVQVQLGGVQTALNLPQEEYGQNGRTQRSVRDLERKSKLYDRDLEDVVDRILEEERRI